MSAQRERDGRRTRSFGAALTLSGWAVLAMVGSAGPARALEITLPAETAKLIESPLPGYGLAQALCQTCHSADYLKMQPVSSRAYWQGAVTKMQKTFGAPIPDAAVEPIVDYLAKTYGTERAGPKPVDKKTEPGKQ